MVECPICHASNPPGSQTCFRCSTPFANDPNDAATVLDTSYDPDATVAVTPGGATGWSVPLQKKTAHDPSAPLEPGTVLGERYEILKRLGEGGMGAVYKARDRELDLLVALKIIRPELASHPEILRRFKQELILARQVTHKNVIRIFELGMADGRKFITMDYIDGRDLKSILVERGKLPPDEAVRIMRQICRGLEAAHAEGVVHRDLKPQNIMVDANGRVWVMDFGLARSMDLVGITRTGALMGTPDYMSPEQARAQKVDARSDLFSLGIIFYEMLTGVLPFRADTMMATLLKRVQEKAPPPNSLHPAIPQRLSDMVMKCLEVDLARRYQSASDILTDIGGDTPSNASMVQTPVVALESIGPGSAFGPRYTIESVIGEGGMGKVYKARDNELDRTVALKLVRRELAGDPNSMQRFKQELQLASRISHRNILRIHDLGDVGGVKFISMMFVEGKDLHEVIQECGRIPTDRLVNFAKQLAAALDAAHTEGVVHRDLKPRNVLIAASDQVYVSDFGLAKSLEGESTTMMTRAGEVLGTPRYMSPEQAESKPADHRSDLYSFGVILYEMATGEAPFSADSSVQVMFQHVTQKPKDPRVANPDLPEYLARIILKCLEKNPEDRYQKAAEILRDLETSQPPSRVVRLRIAETGYPKWLLGSMVALVLLAAVSLSIPSVRDVILRRSAISITTRPVGPANNKYLAILPFRVMGNEPALKYEAEGIVDALSAKLFQMKNLYLASPGAVEKVNAADSIQKISHDLGVKMVLQGTVQSSGDKIDVVLSLDDASGHRVWTEEFPGVRQDLLTLENKIFNKLLNALNLKLSDEELALGSSQPTENVGAYELYLKGRNIMRGKLDASRVKSALDLYQQAIKKDSGFTLAFAGVADASLDMYDYTKDSTWSEKALGAAQHAQTLNDDLPEVHFALGNVYATTGKTAEAIAELTRALTLAPNSDEGYRRLANAYVSAGQKDEAIRAYQRAIEVNPYFWLNYNHLGAAYLQFGQNDKALEAFRHVVELAKDSGAGYENIGIAYFQMGRWNECIPAFEKALQIQPTVSVYSNLGTSYFYLGRYPDAVKMFEKAVEMSPNDQAVLGNLADGYRWLGQQDKAKATYDRAITLAYKALQVNPRDAGTMGFLGQYYAYKGEAQKGLNFIHRARSLDPNDIELIYKEAVIDAVAGKPQDAINNLRQAFQKGYPPEQAKNDPELKTLQSTPEFGKLLSEFARKPV